MSADAKVFLFREPGWQFNFVICGFLSVFMIRALYFDISIFSSVKISIFYILTIFVDVFLAVVFLYVGLINFFSRQVVTLDGNVLQSWTEFAGKKTRKINKIAVSEVKDLRLVRRCERGFKRAILYFDITCSVDGRDLVIVSLKSEVAANEFYKILTGCID